MVLVLLDRGLRNSRSEGNIPSQCPAGFVPALRLRSGHSGRPICTAEAVPLNEGGSRCRAKAHISKSRYGAPDFVAPVRDVVHPPGFLGGLACRLLDYLGIAGHRKEIEVYRAGEFWDKGGLWRIIMYKIG
jgi:hypothetical protein